MTAKKTISAREFHERLKARRKKPLRPEFVEKFNKIAEDEKREREEKKKREKQIARPPGSGSLNGFGDLFRARKFLAGTIANTLIDHRPRLRSHRPV